MSIQEGASVLISEKKHLLKRIEIPGEKKEARWIKNGKGERE